MRILTSTPKVVANRGSTCLVKVEYQPDAFNVSRETLVQVRRCVCPPLPVPQSHDVRMMFHVKHRVRFLALAKQTRLPGDPVSVRHDRNAGSHPTAVPSRTLPVPDHTMFHVKHPGSSEA